jgi:hypothetical protein
VAQLSGCAHTTGDVARITYDDKVIKIPWNELHLRIGVDDD